MKIIINLYTIDYFSFCIYYSSIQLSCFQFNQNNMFFSFYNIVNLINSNYAGERFDLIVETSRPLGRYLINIQGMGDCRDLVHAAFLDYEDNSSKGSVIDEFEFRLTKDDIAFLERGHKCNQVYKGVICALDTKGFIDESVKNDAEETFYVSFDVNTFKDFTDEMSDFGYNIYGYAYYPMYLSEYR